jgi:hypothetical protein
MNAATKKVKLLKNLSLMLPPDQEVECVKLGGPEERSLGDSLGVKACASSFSQKAQVSANLRQQMCQQATKFETLTKWRKNSLFRTNILKNG